MRYSESRIGRSFVIRLEDGEILHESLERFAEEHGIRSAIVIAVGGADRGSRLVVGPDDPASQPIDPMEFMLDGVHEATGTGTIFPDREGRPVLHMHIACGRKNASVTGCVRRGVRVWKVLEVVVVELSGDHSLRERDPATGFELLEPR